MACTVLSAPGRPRLNLTQSASLKLGSIARGKWPWHRPRSPPAGRTSVSFCCVLMASPGGRTRRRCPGRRARKINRPAAPDLVGGQRHPGSTNPRSTHQAVDGSDGRHVGWILPGDGNDRPMLSTYKQGNSSSITPTQINGPKPDFDSRSSSISSLLQDEDSTGSNDQRYALWGRPAALGD